MSLRTKEYFIREAFLSIKRNKYMSIASISTVTISLLILGIFSIVTINTNNIANILESQVQVTTYLKEDVSDKEISSIETTLKEIEGVKEVEYVSKNDALKRFKERLGEQQELLDSLGEENPLPRSFEIHVDEPERVKDVVASVQNISGIEETKFGKDVIEQLFSLTRILRIGGVVLIVFLALATLFIISNTIRITVFSRRKEVNIMKYVGATDWFIRWPFFIEGMLMGFIGSIVSVVILSWFYSTISQSLYSSLAFLPLVPRTPMLYYLSIALIVIGIAIGALGTNISLKKFLKV